MNIKQAKQQIQHAIVAYFSKHEDGTFIIPPEKQRPVFLMGPPGIGKTAIMEQIAEDMQVGLLSYSMTHHTRQSALGLPFIERKNYGGKEYAVSEYTMSEIIASIYDMMEETGIKEGILFLDEINCVSETLSPIMLQFLQYKVFGKHKVPDGWIVVTAGNPPEYNDSVREFDMVTWDRLKRINVEADFDVWKDYAYQVSIHPAIMTYLEIKKEHFYMVESSIQGKSFVTARAWDDLSQMIYLYEKNNIKVDKMLISQYIQNDTIAQDFDIYYDLFNKYKSDYQVDKIINGDADQTLITRAQNAKFDERLSLIGLLLDSLTYQIREVIEQEEIIQEYKRILIDLKSKIKNENDDINILWQDIIKEKNTELEKRKSSNSLSIKEQRKCIKLINKLEEYAFKINKIKGVKEAFNYLKTMYEEMQIKYQEEGTILSQKMSNVFNFLTNSFDKNNEILIFISELTLNSYTARFINRFACKEFFEYSKELMLYEKGEEIKAEVESVI